MEDVTNHVGVLSGRKVMLVEDDVYLSDLIAKKLSKQGTKLLHAANGEDAIRLLQNEDVPDIILLDIILPGVNGFEVLGKIKQDGKTRAIPVIILSNLDQQSDLDKGKELGAVKFLIKATVTLDEIVKEAESVLAMQKK